jgi:monoamine oxidase
MRGDVDKSIANIMRRRDFLKTISLAAVASAVPARAAQGRRVLVAGAGLAGLAAAYELAQRGYQVTVIEARNRHGGRVFTMREPFDDGLRVELGGETLGNGYKRFLTYTSKFGIATDEETVDAFRALPMLLKGQFYASGVAPNPHPYGLTGEESKFSPPTLLARYFRVWGESLARRPERASDFDKLSVADLLRVEGVSEQALRLMNMSLNYNDIETISVAGALFDLRRRANGGAKIARVRDGNSALPDAFVRELIKAGVKINYNTALLSVEHDANGIRAAARSPNGRRATITAEHFVSTLPAIPLRRVRFTPALPDAQLIAIRLLPYTRVTKVFLQAKRDNWDKNGYGTGVWTDTPAERILHLAGQPGQPRGIFALWLDGLGTLKPDKMPDAARVKWGMQTFKEVLPACAADVEKGATVSWHNDRWAGGAYAHFQKNQFAAFFPALQKPFGVLHFAGEHTAEKNNGMEGALESAERVVREIAG